MLRALLLAAASLAAAQSSGSAPVCAPAPAAPAAPMPKASLVFAELSAAELSGAASFLLANRSFNLTAYPAVYATSCLACSWLYHLELWTPNKTAALAYLDGSGAKPAREARAILFLGAEHTPAIKEVVVGPLPTPTYWRPLVHGNQVSPSWNQRMSDEVEVRGERGRAGWGAGGGSDWFAPTTRLVHRPRLRHQYGFLYSVFYDAHAQGVGELTRTFLSGYTMDAECGTDASAGGPSSGCLIASDGSPKGTREVRSTIFWFLYALPGNDLQPTGLEARVWHTGFNTSAWVRAAGTAGGRDETADAPAHRVAL